MAEVLITVMIVMVFGTLLFSSASRRYARAERNIAKMEARLAAESVVQVLAGKILKEESSEVIEKLVSRHGLPVTEGVCLGGYGEWRVRKDQDCRDIFLARGWL